MIISCFVWEWHLVCHIKGGTLIWGYLRVRRRWRYLGLSGRKKEETGEDYITRTFMINTPRKIIIRVIKSRKLIWAGHVVRVGEKTCIQSSCWEVLDIDVKIILKMDLKGSVRRTRIGIIWLRTRKSGGILRTLWCSFGFCKRRGIYLYL